MTKTHLQNGLRLLIGPLLVGWLLYTIGLEQVWATLQQAQGQFFAIALGCYGFTVLLRTLRWQTFLQAQGLPVTLRQLLPLELVGGFFNLILPSSVGGDVVKFYRLRQHYPSAIHPRIAGTLIADRLAGIIVLLWLGAVMTPFALGNNSLTVTTVALTVLGTLVLVALLTAQGRALIERLPGVSFLLKHKAIHSLYNSLTEYTAPVLLRAFGIALLFNVAMIGSYMALGAAFHLPVSWSVYFVIVPLLSLAQAIPLTPNGLGMREGGAVALLGLFNVSQTGALALALGYLTLLVLFGLVGAILTLAYSLRPLLHLPSRSMTTLVPASSRSITRSDGGSSTL
jgi:uncharacterized protein (TIRG00374 family)